MCACAGCTGKRLYVNIAQIAKRISLFGQLRRDIMKARTRANPCAPSVGVDLADPTEMVKLLNQVIIGNEMRPTMP